MLGVPDTLIEIKGQVPMSDEIAQVERDIRSLYPPESARPNLQLTDVVEWDGRRFVRLSTLAGSLHFVLRRGVRLKTFPWVLLWTPDRSKELADYVYAS